MFLSLKSLLNFLNEFLVTMDKYEAGDISGKFGNLGGLSSVHKEVVDVQMDLFSRYGILNRGLVIHRNDASGSRWVCANIIPDASSKQLSATANFTTTSGLQGTVNLVCTSFIQNTLLKPVYKKHVLQSPCIDMRNMY